MTFPANYYADTVSVETYQGDGAYGPVYASAVDKQCYVSESVKLVRDTNGVEVVSGTSLFGPPELADACTPGSRVTVSGHAAFVITAARPKHPLAPAMNHARVHLT